MRKIIHVDMDAFYASVEQRDDPALRGRPVVVAWRGSRSVVCAASYEARVFGVRSACGRRAERLCPARCRTTGLHVIDRIAPRRDPMVTPIRPCRSTRVVSTHAPKSALSSATEVAKCIRQAIVEETKLTASAGVAPNKFLAKIASDWRKPNGLFVIRPHEAEAFLAPLPVAKIPGVGKVMDAKLEALGIRTCADLRNHDVRELERRFGRYGRRLAELALGIDERAVNPDQPVQSISAEDTFARAATRRNRPMIATSSGKSWSGDPRSGRRTVVLAQDLDFHI
jgi:DNA polymerase-4